MIWLVSPNIVSAPNTMIIVIALAIIFMVHAMNITVLIITECLTMYTEPKDIINTAILMPVIITILHTFAGTTTMIAVDIVL